MKTLDDLVAEARRPTPSHLKLVKDDSVSFGREPEKLNDYTTAQAQQRIITMAQLHSSMLVVGDKYGSALAFASLLEDVARSIRDVVSGK